VHDELELRVTAFAQAVDDLRGRGRLHRRAVGDMDLERRRGRVGDESPSRRRRPRGSKAEQAPDRRLIVDQLPLGRLGNPVGARLEIAQLRRGDQIGEKLRTVLQLSKVIGVQDDRLDVLRL